MSGGRLRDGLVMMCALMWSCFITIIPVFVVCVFMT